jgi:ribosomal protein S18 acetylase RimI-like enzyme
MTTSNENTRIEIRSATRADRAFLNKLANRLAQFDRPAWRSQEEIAEGDRRALNEALESPSSGTSLFIAELNRLPAGCLLMWTLQDYFSQRRHAHVSVIAVTEQAEGRGVGRALMTHAEAWARERGYQTITLSVFEGNRRAQGLYERAGYTVEMHRMTKQLKP